VTRRGRVPSSTLEALVALSLIGNSGDTKIERITKGLPTSDANRALLETVLARAGWLPEAAAERIDWALESARSALVTAERLGLSVVDLSSDHYPALLREIADPPIVLWAQGRVEALGATQVAIVGARAATPAGIAIASGLARDLAGAGVTVVSGLARGVDGAAHHGALLGGGETVAVLGCGVDVVYPKEHRGLTRRIIESGVVVSAFPPGTPPRAHHFPLRNRIISGLSKAVVVIEASDRSGSLITARMAMDQNRDVLAVPGGVLSGQSRGCHGLIRDGARLVESVNDILEEIGWATVPLAPANKSLQLSQLEETMAAGEPYTLDELSVRTGRPAADLLAELGELEVRGRVFRATGGGFVRT
jgi:DNA processing protein